METLPSLPEIGKTLDRLLADYKIKQERRPLRLEDFSAALKANALLLAAGIFGGLILIWFDHWFRARWTPRPWFDVVLTLAEHVGVGLIVAAIAVLAFEWVSESRRAQVLSLTLAQLLAHGARDRLESAHAMLLDEDAPRFESLRRLAESIESLRQGDHWTRRPLIEFLADILSETATNAASLAGASRKLRAHVANEQERAPLLFDDGAKRTDKLLRTLLTYLPAGGKYQAVSNALIWTDLTGFEESHRLAIESVSVYRS